MKHPAHLLNSSMGLLCVCVCCSARGSSLRLLEKQCRCLTSSRTASTCSSVGLKGSCRGCSVKQSYYHKANASSCLSGPVCTWLLAIGFCHRIPIQKLNHISLKVIIYVSHDPLANRIHPLYLAHYICRSKTCVTFVFIDSFLTNWLGHQSTNLS